MEEWKEVRLGDYCDFQNGYAFKSSEFKTNGEYKIVKIKELKDGLVKFFNDSASVDIQDIKEFEKYKIYRNDVLFALTGDPVSKPNPLSWVGRVSIYRSDENALLNQRTCKIKKSERIDNKFLYYYFRQWENFYALASKATGSASQANISTNTIADTIIKLPPLPTQQKIAAILSSLDDKIELNNKINTNLEQQTQALFKNWFVDFEPFGGKMPEGWKECKAEEYFEITIGKTPPRKEQEWFSEEKTNQTMKWVSISDMGSCGLFISDSSEYLTTEAVAKFNVKVVPANTIILSFKLTVGRIAITDDEMCTNEAIAHFGTKNKVINEYLYLYLKNFNYQTMGSTSSIATAVNSKIIKAMPFILPDEKTINDFHLATNSLFEKIRENQHENSTLSTIRDTLLPKLMNGEIEVKK